MLIKMGMIDIGRVVVPPVDHEKITEKVIEDKKHKAHCNKKSRGNQRNLSQINHYNFQTRCLSVVKEHIQFIPICAIDKFFASDTLILANEYWFHISRRCPTRRVGVSNRVCRLRLLGGFLFSLEYADSDDCSFTTKEGITKS